MTQKQHAIAELERMKIAHKRRRLIGLLGILLGIAIVVITVLGLLSHAVWYFSTNYTEMPDDNVFSAYFERVAPVVGIGVTVGSAMVIISIVLRIIGRAGLIAQKTEVNSFCEKCHDSKLNYLGLHSESRGTIKHTTTRTNHGASTRSVHQTDKYHVYQCPNCGHTTSSYAPLATWAWNQ